jgi:hypothetical protein
MFVLAPIRRPATDAISEEELESHKAMVAAVPHGQLKAYLLSSRTCILF